MKNRYTKMLKWVIVTHLCVSKSLCVSLCVSLNYLLNIYLYKSVTQRHRKWGVLIYGRRWMGIHACAYIYNLFSNFCVSVSQKNVIRGPPYS
jgi:hypothetical protein